jgi:hypothetical protein
MPSKALHALVLFAICCPILGYGLGVLQGRSAFTSRFRFALPIYLALVIPCLILYEQYRTPWLPEFVMIGGVCFALTMSAFGRHLKGRTG